MAEGTTLILTHAGTTPQPILVDDLRANYDGSNAARHEGNYVPMGGTLELTFSGLVPISYEKGDIRRYIDQGLIRGAFNFGTVYLDAVDGIVSVIATAVAPSPDVYQAKVNDSIFLVDTVADAIRIDLLAGVTNVRGQIRVIDIGSNAGVNNVQLFPAAGETIDSGGSYTFNVSDGNVEFVWQEATSDWILLVPAVGATPVGPAGGGLGGTYPNPSVTPAAGLDTTAIQAGSAAGGGLGGTYPNPSVTPAAGLDTTAIQTGDAAGGGLGGTYPNPTVNSPSITEALVTPYAVTITDQNVLVNPAVPAPFVVNLPAGATHNAKVLTIKDKTGTAGVNNITINANGAETMEGAGSLVLASNYAALTIVFSGVEWSVV